MPRECDLAEQGRGSQRGRIVAREYESSTIDGQPVQRTVWMILPAPHFTAEPDGWLASEIPSLPSLRSTHA